MNADLAARAALVAFLRAQLDGDEHEAIAAGGEEWHSVRPGSGMTLVALDVVIDEDRDVAFDVERDQAVHIAAWDPARVLAEVKAKRALLDQFEIAEREVLVDDRTTYVAGGVMAAFELVLACLALPYADCEGWGESWRLET